MRGRLLGLSVESVYSIEGRYFWEYSYDSMAEFLGEVLSGEEG